MANNHDEWDVNTLMERLHRGEELFILDIRNREEFENSHLEGKKGLSILNIPYFEILEEGGSEDFAIAVQQYAEKKLSGKLPKDKSFLVVCNRGNSSAVVAGALKTAGYKAYSLAGGMKAWGNYYDIIQIETGNEFQIYQISRAARGCLSYLVISDKQALLIDPARHEKVYLDLIQKLGVQMKLIIDTHAHADHISGGKALSKTLNVPYYLHPYDGIHPMDMLPATFPYDPAWKEQIFTIGKAKLEAIHIPGHTLGNLALLLNGKYLFTGDSIFIQSISRPDLGGKVEAWADLHYHSLQKLLELPEETVVLPAHFSSLKEANEQNQFSKTLGDLKKTNEGLIMAQKSREEFYSYIMSNLPKFPKEYIEIKRVNLGLVQPDERHASELELGKNICALNKKG